MTEHAIELAYQAHQLIPLQLYRTNKLKKTDNPVVAAPALFKAMIHIGPENYEFSRARRAALDLAYDRRRNACVRDFRKWQQIIEGVRNWDELIQFLDTLTIFLKATSETKEEKGMRAFDHKASEIMKPRQVSKTAQELAREKIDDEVIMNKLETMSAHVTAARDKWEALVALARFYPRKGIPKTYVDALVEQLETTDLRSFKQIVAQSLIFSKALQVRRKGGK
jgi:hypothetical protein